MKKRKRKKTPKKKRLKHKPLDKIIEVAKKKGMITYEELNDLLPDQVVSSEEIDEILASLGEKNIKIVDGRSEEEANELEEAVKKKEALKAELHPRISHIDDPVKMYLRQMGTQA